VLEKGVFAPRLAMLPTFGKSEPTDDSALLAFSPNANGITTLNSGQEQGFAASLANGGIDPINVFPLGPNNADSSESNNYSPLWDAHVSAWTPKAIKEGKVHRILSMDEQKQLIADGYLTSATGDDSSPKNAFVGGRQRPRVRVPSSPPFLSSTCKELAISVMVQFGPVRQVPLSC
jgi:hypothetical protein